MKLIENGEALQQVEDLINNPGENPIDPGMMIEEPVHNSAPLTQFEESLKRENLRESKRSEASIAEYLKTTNNPSFKDYQQSKYYDPSIKSTWFFNRDVKNLMARGDTNQQVASTAVVNSGARKGSAAVKAVEDTTYRRPEEGTYKNPQYLTAMQKKYELDVLDRNSKGTAEEMYDNMESTIRDILTQESTVRHCLIYGDPGIGKCVNKDTKIKIKMDDLIAQELESYLQSL